ncbi:class C sortase [Bifidobacterium felsineum]|uniref:class C sortase n=1 Tax=Bifidobacterium felsineum TaxID=2045440 RepID=UPI001BDC11FB|nr:class C sortase [Bifidobacterium felsineum]MBT1164673.1 class C sortase [Bifidobacterium felsineum]
MLVAPLIIMGAIIMLAPGVLSLAGLLVQDRAILTYETGTSRTDAKVRDRLWMEAVDWNRSHMDQPVSDPFTTNTATNDMAYNRLLDVEGNGIMGVLRIPKIGLRLPIRHGTSEESLSDGVGHLATTPLPIGGKGHRSVLAAHRGLPDRELFTRLDELKENDLFNITVLDRTHWYRVTDVKVVDPSDVNAIQPIPGRDLITLLTCTPYGVNTMRLLVTGERTAPPSTPVTSSVMPGRESWFRYGTGPLLILTGGSAVLIIRRHRLSRPMGRHVK